MELKNQNQNQNQNQIKAAAEIIRNGGVAAFPTETVYGLGANAFDERAVARVFEIKRRPRFDPLIIHVGGAEWLGDLVTNIPEPAMSLIDALWPGPLTVVLPKKPAVPDITTSGLPGAALRGPSNGIARKLIELAGVPIAAPSANLFGGVSPTTAQHVRDGLGGAPDMILDGGECEIGVESTIISFMTDIPTLLRPGGTPLEEIEGIIGEVAIPARGELAGQSPGRCERHYATAVPLILIEDIGDIPRNHTKKVGLLAVAPLDRQSDDHLPANVIVKEYLSRDGNLREAACGLFAAMRRLDAAGLDIIVALPAPEAGLGRAINDRLYRAARKQAD